LAGSYTNYSPDLQPLLGVSTDSGSTWTYPTLTIPSDVAGNLYLSAGVSCTSTVCVAGGKYLNGSYAAPLLYMSTDGGSSWTLAIASNSITSGPTPSDWVFGQITSVGCSVSACMAAGTYHSSDVSSSHFPYAAVAVESDSSWAWNVVADASTATPAGISDVASINGFLSATCTGTTCLASGAYEDTGGTQYPMVAQTIGLAALTYTLDSSWSSPPHLFSNLGTFAEISCSGAVCTAAGSYQDSSSDTYPLVGVSSNSGTAWTFDIDATPDTLPIFFDSIGRFTATRAN